MYKIALLGCENSHSAAFLDLISQGLYPDIEVIGVYSDEKESCDYLKEKYGVYVMNSYDEFVGKVDGIMITARHGDNHYKYAKPYLDDGIPMFIDKPITITVEEAEEFMAEARKRNVRLIGGSTCAYVKETLEMAEVFKSNELGEFVGGNLICPLHIFEKYGGFYFYAQHLVQIMTTVFGTGVKEVLAHKNGDNYTLIVKYDNFEITASYRCINHYVITVCGKDNAKTCTFTVDQDCFRHEMDEMKRLLDGGEQQFTYEEFILPVYLMNAIERSAKSGKWEKIFTEK